MDEDQDKAQLNNKESDEVVEENPSDDPSDKLTPEHPRFKDVLHERNDEREARLAAEKEIEQLKQQLASVQSQSSEDDFTEEERVAAEAIERKILKKKGYLTKQDLEEMQRVEKRAQTFDRLQQKYPGGKGQPPKFDPAEVEIYARRNGYGDNYEAAYKDMHFDALVQVSLNRPQTQVPSSEKPTGGEHIVASGIDLERAKTDKAYYAKNRDKIMAAMKASAKAASQSI